MGKIYKETYGEKAYDSLKENQWEGLNQNFWKTNRENQKI